MALFFECMLQCARKLLDTADIVREAIYQRLSAPASLRDNFRVPDNSAAIGLLSVEIW